MDIKVLEYVVVTYGANILGLTTGLHSRPGMAAAPGHVTTGSPWFEMILTLASLSLLLGYHLRLIARIRYAPLTTAIGLTNQVRQVWVATVRQEQRDILAVQTLRNWIMAASFLASTAILISLGLLNLAFTTDKAREMTQALNLVGPSQGVLWAIKILLLMVNFFAAFFNFSLTIRYFNHVSMMINVPENADLPVSSSSVARALNRGALHYTFGMRGYYLAVPFVLWLFGPLLMLLGAVVLVAILVHLDRPA